MIVPSPPLAVALCRRVRYGYENVNIAVGAMVATDAAYKEIDCQCCVCLPVYQNCSHSCKFVRGQSKVTVTTGDKEKVTREPERNK